MPNNVVARPEGGAAPVASARKGAEFVYNAAWPLDGIIAYLTRESDGAVDEVV